MPNNTKPVSAQEAFLLAENRRKNGEFGERPRFAGEGAGAYLDANSAWDDLENGESREWVDGQVPSDRLSSIELHRTEDGDPGSMFVQATKRFRLKEPDHALAVKYPREFEAFIRENYDDAYPVQDGTKWDMHYSCDEDDLRDGETFPTDIDGLTDFVLDKSAAERFDRANKSEDFETRIRAHLVDVHRSSWTLKSVAEQARGQVGPPKTESNQIRLCDTVHKTMLRNGASFEEADAAVQFAADKYKIASTRTPTPQVGPADGGGPQIHYKLEWSDRGGSTPQTVDIQARIAHIESPDFRVEKPFPTSVRHNNKHYYPTGKTADENGLKSAISKDIEHTQNDDQDMRARPYVYHAAGAVEDAGRKWFNGLFIEIDGELWQTAR